MAIEDWPLIHGLVYHPRRGQVIDPGSLGIPGMEFTRVEAPGEGDISLAGWVVKSVGQGGDPDRIPGQLPRRVVYFPGRGGHRGFRLPELRILIACQAQVLLCDYRGYAENPGRPSEEGLAHDARTVCRFAVDALGWPVESLVFYGESLGGAVAIRLANELQERGRAPIGIILRSTFPSLTAVARSHHPWLGWLIPPVWYPSDQRIGRLWSPILQLHGELDQLVPLRLAQDLWQGSCAAKSGSGISRFVILPNCGHNDPPTAAAQPMQQAIAGFLQALPG